MKPKVSIIIPCHNYARFLGFCLESVLGQTFRDFEIIIIDDASEDNTQELLKKFSDPRIRCIRHSSNMGHVYTYNEGIDLARGEYIVVLSADDLLGPNFLSTCLKKFSEESDLGLVYTAIATIDETGRVIDSNPKVFHPKNNVSRLGLAELLVSLNCIPHCSAILPKKVYERVGKYDSQLPFSCDWDMWLRVAQNYPLAFINQPHAYYRIHTTSLSKGLGAYSFADNIMRVLNKFYSYPALPENIIRIKKTVYSKAYLAISVRYYKEENPSLSITYCYRAIKNNLFYIFNKEFASCYLKSLLSLTLYKLKNERNLRIIRKAIVFPIDFLIFSLGLILFVILIPLLKYYAKKYLIKREKALIILQPSIDIATVLSQWGESGFDRVFKFNPNGYFKKTFYVYYLARSNSYQTLKEGYIFRESKIPFGILYLTYQWKVMYQLLSLVFKEKAVLIHAFTPYEVGILGYIVGKITQTPFCVSIFADYDDAFRLNRGDSVTIYGLRKIAKMVERFVLKRSRLVIVRSNSLIKYAQENGANLEFIKVEPLAIPIEDFLFTGDGNLRHALKLNNNPVVLSAGRLSPVNYSQDIIKIAKIVCARRPETKFILLADGPQRDYLEKLAKELNIYQNIIFTGWQPQQIFLQYRFLADINICLKAGFSMIEAALSAKPIVTYDVDWHRELIKDGQTGMMVKEGDIEEAAERILALLDDPQLSAKLGQNARNFVIENYSYKKIAQKKIAWFEELINQTLQCNK